MAATIFFKNPFSVLARCLHLQTICPLHVNPLNSLDMITYESFKSRRRTNLNNETVFNFAMFPPVSFYYLRCIKRVRRMITRTLIFVNHGPSGNRQTTLGQVKTILKIYYIKLTCKPEMRNRY